MRLSKYIYRIKIYLQRFKNFSNNYIYFCNNKFLLLKSNYLSTTYAVSHHRWFIILVHLCHFFLQILERSNVNNSVDLLIWDDIFYCRIRFFFIMVLIRRIFFAVVDLVWPESDHNAIERSFAYRSVQPNQEFEFSLYRSRVGVQVRLSVFCHLLHRNADITNHDKSDKF